MCRPRISPTGLKARYFASKNIGRCPESHQLRAEEPRGVSVQLAAICFGNTQQHRCHRSSRAVSNRVRRTVEPPSNCCLHHLTMREEVESAVDFLSGILSKRTLTNGRIESFSMNLQNVLCSHYENHWFPEKPYKGSAYRCLRIVNHKMDPLVSKAGAESGITETQLLNMLPREFTMWVDPYEVSYRIGEDGSVGVLFDRQCGNKVSEVDIPSRSSSPGSTGSRTPSPPVQQPNLDTHHLQHQEPLYHHPQQLQQHPQQHHLQQQYHSQDYMYSGYYPESSSHGMACKDQMRVPYNSSGFRSQSPAQQITNWEYLAAYAAS